jgi:hypothetical protein
MVAHLATLVKEGKGDSEFIVKMFHSLSSHFKQIMIPIKILLDVLSMSVTDLMRSLNEAFEEVLALLQHDRKLYLTEEWDARWKKREAENHSSNGARGGDVNRGGGRQGGRASWHCGKLGHWPRMCHSNGALAMQVLLKAQEGACTCHRMKRRPQSFS